MKEYLVKKAIYSGQGEMDLFANPGDYIVLAPDNHTFILTKSNGSVKTMNAVDPEIYIKQDYIVQTFNTKDNDIPVIERARQNMVEHPSHYSWLKKKCGVEPYQITRHFDNNIGNVLKYCMRCGHKDEEGMTTKEKAIEDLEKALFYLKDEIKLMKES